MKLRLSSKFILSIILIEALMLTVLVWNSVRIVSTSHAEVLRYNLDSESELLANVLAPGLAVSDRAIINDALVLIKKNVNILYANVSDNLNISVASFGNVPNNIEYDKNFEQARKTGAYDIYQPIELFKQPLGTLQIGYSTKYIEDLINKTRTQNTLIAMGELLLSILMALFIGYMLTKSLRKLEAGAHALTRDELEYKIELDSNDEMGDLARAFNKLAAHLSITRKELYTEHEILEKQTEHLTNLLNGINAVILESNPKNNQITYVSEEASKLLGYKLQDWYKPGFLESCVHSNDRSEFKSKRKMAIEILGSTMIDFRVVHKNGHTIDIRSVNSINHDEMGELVCRSILLDITDQRKNEKRIAYLADHDALTGLFNRYRFQQELERSVEYARRYQQSSILMFIDLDQFKYINDTLGHQTGDMFLKQTAIRLSESLRKVDIFGRLGGDEFAIILPNTSKNDAEKIVKNLMLNLSEGDTSSKEQGMSISASIGMVIFPEQGIIPDNLLAMADAAMYSAKDKGRNTYCFYNENDNSIKSMQDKLQWEKKIRSALDNDRFVLHFQPIFDLSTRKVIHYEALLRMIGDNDELIMPGEFLEIAERFGMIVDIDHWVLKNAIKIQAESMRTDLPVSLAINISGRHFGSPKVLNWIKTFIEESGAEPAKLIFEITETAAVENTEQATYFTEALHALGCKIALDDFGIGFSSFHYLKHMPVDIVKLDGSFVRNLGQDNFDKIFVKTMSDMAHGLRMKCVAEFVEREEIIEILKELGVEMGQGYHLAKPGPDFLRS